MPGRLRTGRRVARQALNDASYVLELRALPPRVGLFQLRARARARRSGDVFSLASATRPADLSRLLALAAGRRYVVELGTGTGWTTIALALDDPAREIVSFDPVDRPERARYTALVRRQVEARIEFVDAPGVTGPRSARQVDLLYIDSSHAREDTVTEVTAWTPVLAADALIVFDDYDNEQYPGVREAVEQLGLSGSHEGALFVHRRAVSDG
ncbi:MAG: class I SAM-dependent methyltransferase [Solirubrobacteraceae bacterium]